MFFKRQKTHVRVIAGLGNPGKKYEGTRHNVGFEVLDLLAKEAGIEIKKRKFRGDYGKGKIDGIDVILVKPQTYMNVSGECIRPFLDYFGADPAADLIVICDDVNLDTGRLRIREKGSAGGHNGLKSIILQLGGSQDFLRVRVGVGQKPDEKDLADHVLDRFDAREAREMEEAKARAKDAVRALLTEPVSDVMTRYNRAGDQAQTH